MSTKTASEQAATFLTSTFKDGEPSDGSPTEQEQAAAAANASKADAAGDGAGAPDQEQQSDDAAAGVEDGSGGSDGADAEDAGGEGEQVENTQKSEKNGEEKSAKKGKPTANERISDLTAKWRGEERRADTERSRAERLQAELDAVKRGTGPLTPQHSDATGGDTPPDPSKFDFGELDPKYIAALARFETTQALKAHQADESKSRQAAAADAKRQETAEKSDKLVRAGLELHGDFDEVVMQGAREGKWDLSQTLGELILDSEYGPQIAYDLASDPAESRRIAKLSPSQQAAYFGRQEAKFEAAKSSQASKTPKAPQAAPPPKMPRGGSGSNTVGADSSDFAAVEKAWKSGALR